MLQGPCQSKWTISCRPDRPAICLPPGCQPVCPEAQGPGAPSEDLSVCNRLPGRASLRHALWVLTRCADQGPRLCLKCLSRMKGAVPLGPWGLSELPACRVPLTACHRESLVVCACCVLPCPGTVRSPLFVSTRTDEGRYRHLHGVEEETEVCARANKSCLRFHS